MQTFNGLSSAVPRVQKLNKYLSYKYRGTSTDSKELFSNQLCLFFPCLTDEHVDEAFRGFRFTCSPVLDLGRLMVQALIEQRRRNFPALLIPTAPGFLQYNLYGHSREIFFFQELNLLLEMKEPKNGHM